MCTASFRSTGRQWRHAVNHVLIEQNISGTAITPQVLIGCFGGGARHITQARGVETEAGSLVHLLDQPDGQRLAVRKEDPTDRSAKRFWLADEGETLAPQLKNVLDGLRYRILSNADWADLQAGNRVLQAFTDISALEEPETSEPIEAVP